VRVTKAEGGHDIVLSAKTTAPAATFDDLRLAVNRLFRKAGLAPESA
jgi:hypothetical protein